MRNVKGNIIVLLFIFLLFLFSCKSDTQFEKYPDFTKNIVDVSNKITYIENDLIFGNSRLSIVDDFLLLKDLKAVDRGLLLFDKNTFQYLTSTGIRGQGPGEIPNYGQLLTIVDSKNRLIYGVDYAKSELVCFSVDSVLVLKEYLPRQVLRLNGVKMPGRMELYNDSIFLGRGLQIIGKRTFGERTSRFNYKNGFMEPFGYENPELKTNKDTRAYFSFSHNSGVYVNCYANQDLMTICKLDGSLLFNVYGSEWGKNNKYRKSFYKGVQIFNDKIIASYIGAEAVVVDEYKRRRGVLPSRFLVFDLSGNYLKTLDVKHEVANFCIDEDSGRLIMYLDDTEQALCYLDLKEFL